MPPVSLPDTQPVLSVPSPLSTTDRPLNIDPELTEVIFSGRVEPLFKLGAVSPSAGGHTNEARFRIRKPDGTVGRSLLFSIGVSQDGAVIQERGVDETGFITFTSTVDTTTRSGRFGFTRSRIVGKSVSAALPSIEFLNELHSPNVLQVSRNSDFFSDYRVIPSDEGSFPPSVMEYLHSLAILETRSQQPVLIPDLTTVTEGEVFDANEAAALISGETLRSLWTQLNWQIGPPSELAKRRTGEVDLGSYYQLVIVGPLIVNVGGNLLTLGTVQKSLLSARLSAQGEKLQAVPFLTDAMDRTFDPVTPPPDPSRQRVMGKVMGSLDDWLANEHRDPQTYRHDLNAAGAGRSGRSDISERMEEFLADEAKR